MGLLPGRWRCRRVQPRRRAALKPRAPALLSPPVAKRVSASSAEEEQEQQQPTESEISPGKMRRSASVSVPLPTASSCARAPRLPPGVAGGPKDDGSCRYPSRGSGEECTTHCPFCSILPLVRGDWRMASRASAVLDRSCIPAWHLPFGGIAA